MEYDVWITQSPRYTSRRFAVQLSHFVQNWSVHAPVLGRPRTPSRHDDTVNKLLLSSRGRFVNTQLFWDDIYV